MATTDELERFYAKVMNCQNYPKATEACPEIIRKKEINPVPRGFYFESPQVKFLAVAKNAGHAKDDEPDQYYSKGKKLEGLPLVKAHLNFVRGLFESGKSKFHRNLLCDLKRILGLPEELNNEHSVKEVFSKAAYTNLVKCSTENVRENLRDYPITTNTCFEKFLVTEVKKFNPQIILALGIEAEWFLRKHNELDQLGIPNKCILKVPHPSIRAISNEVDEIREKIRECDCDCV